MVFIDIEGASVYIGLMSDLVDALKRELVGLESDLENDPRYRKIARIRSLLAEYSAKDAEPPELADKVAITLRKRISPHGDTKRARIHKIIQAKLANGEQVHRKRLLEALQSNDLLVGDVNPMASLAAYLSSFPDFSSTGEGFWELSSPKTEEAPANAEASNSSDSGSQSLFREPAVHDR
jgi:hypothetical protein